MTHRRLFSTNDVSDGDAYEAWRCRDWPSLAPVFDTQPPEGLFYAESETFGFRDLAVTRSRMAGLDYARSARLQHAGQRPYPLRIDGRVRRDGLLRLRRVPVPRERSAR